MFNFFQATQQTSSNEQQIDLTNVSQTTDVPPIINDFDAISQSPNETNLLKMDVDDLNRILNLKIPIEFPVLI